MTTVAPIRVLLVDDHFTILWGVEALLKSSRVPMEVVGKVNRIAEAATVSGQVQPDVILLDLDFGGESSIDYLPQLVANPKTKVLILTGIRDEVVLDTAIIRGARGIVSKEAPPEQVLKAIEVVSQGELWLPRETVTRVLGNVLHGMENVRKHAEPESRPILTTKERAVIRLIVEQSGACNKTIASRLSISEHTLRNHLTSIYQKLGVRNRLELYVYATKNQLGSPED